MFGEVTDGTYTAASLIELLHTATLVHDDVVDDAFEERLFIDHALWKINCCSCRDFYISGLLLTTSEIE